MNFELSEDQRAIEDVARRFATEKLAPHAADQAIAAAPSQKIHRLTIDAALQKNLEDLARERRLQEHARAHVAVTLLARDGRVLADQREGRARVALGAEHRVVPDGVLVTRLAVQAELARVAIAVTRGARVGHARPEVGAVAGTTRRLRVRARERESRALVIERHVRPARLRVARAALGRRVRRDRLR